ncbi:MAG: recombinase family protein [Waterburya sp.]
MKIGYFFGIGEKGIDTVPKQIEALKQAGCQVIFGDLIDSFLDEQSNLESVFAYAREGDIVVIWQIFCLAPRLRRFVNIGQRLHQRKIGLQVLIGEASQIKPHTPDSEKMMALFSSFANLEREYASSRTKKGLAKLKAQGKVLGRRSKFEQWKSRLIEMQQLGYSAYGISQETGLCYGTVKKYLKLIDE